MGTSSLNDTLTCMRYTDLTGSVNNIYDNKMKHIAVSAARTSGNIMHKECKFRPGNAAPGYRRERNVKGATGR